MRQVMAADAQRAAGARPTAEPFTRTRSRRVPAPPLRVGIACDISGSMGAFTGPVASAAWILARAASDLPAATDRHRHLRAAASTPSPIPATPPPRSPTSGPLTVPSRLCRAIDALDGALGLSRPGAARLLVIVSDGFNVAPRRDPPAPSGASARLAKRRLRRHHPAPRPPLARRDRMERRPGRHPHRPRRRHRGHRPRRHPRPDRLNPCSPGRASPRPRAAPPGQRSNP